LTGETRAGSCRRTGGDMILIATNAIFVENRSIVCREATRSRLAETTFEGHDDVRWTTVTTWLPRRSVQCESKNHPCYLRFCDIFHKRLRILNQFFTHLLRVPIYARLQIFIQLSQILTKLCHIKRVCLVHNAQNVRHRPKRTRSGVCESRW